MYKGNIQNCIIGRERSGKSNFAKNLCEKILKKTGKGIVVYNIGELNDYSDYKEIKILDVEQTVNLLPETLKKKYKDNSEILYFSFSGKIYKAKDFYKVIAGNKVFIHRIVSPSRQRMFYNFLFFYAANIQLIFEDSRVLFQSGVPKEAQQIFGRKYHAGLKTDSKKKGIDVHFMFHGFSEVNQILYNYMTSLTVFNFNVIPDKTDLRNNEIRELVNNIHTDLKQSKEFEHYQVFIRGFPEIVYKKFGCNYLNT